MARQVQVGSSVTNPVVLPDGRTYTASQIATLTDEQYAKISSTAFSSGELVDLGSTGTPGDAVVTQATHVAQAAALTTAVPAALTSSVIATADGSDATTTQALANATKAAFNLLRADVAAIQVNQTAIRADLVVLRTTLNAAVAAITGTGKAMA